MVDARNATSEEIGLYTSHIEAMFIEGVRFASAANNRYIIHIMS